MTMTDEEIISALHRMVDEDGADHQVFLAAGLTDTQRQAIAQALRAVERIIADFHLRFDQYAIELEGIQRAFISLRRGGPITADDVSRMIADLRTSHDRLKDTLWHALMVTPGAREAADRLEAMPYKIRSAEPMRDGALALLRDMTKIDPLITDASSGRRVCFFGCGYNPVDAPVYAPGETQRAEHGPHCPRLRAAWQVRRWEEGEFGEPGSGGVVVIKRGPQRQ